MEKRLSDEAALRLVIEGTVSETGRAFFRSLVRNLCRALNTHAAWVTEYLPEEHKLRALAMWMNGEFIDHYEYRIEGTPCQAVLEQGKLVHFPNRLIELFPIDNDLVEMSAVSYLGAPILDTDGTVLGHLGLLHNKPMPKDPKAIALFEIFAARAAGEMRRLKAEASLRAREQQLSQLFNNTMDAIVVMDDSLRISKANPAAEKLFSCRGEALVGESILKFLTGDGPSQLKAFCARLKARAPGKQQLWLPQDLTIRSRDKSVFPAEATLSRFATREGAFYTLILRNTNERMEAVKEIQRLRQETEFLREVARESLAEPGIIGTSDCMKVVGEAIAQVAPTESTVLIHGETGTGKELVARAIHEESLRADKPLILVNCAAIPANLMESEFFGHEKGAFTGALQRREGRFKLADGGTIFLDEVGELPVELQAKLLRVIQEGEFEPLGSSRTVSVDIRIVAATHRDLKTMVSKGAFREDLFFRLNVFPIEIPPLRQRGKDIELLAGIFVKRFSARLGRIIDPISPEQVQYLRGYDWPGNVRELQNVIERAVILTTGSRLALERAMSGVSFEPPDDPRDSLENKILTAAELEDMERANMERALAASNWKVSGKSGAARLLGVPPSTLSSRMRALGIHRPRREDPHGNSR